jgi:predicted metal-binding membrane protein
VIAAFVLVEKVVPRGVAFSKIAGAALLACGAVMALGMTRTGLL